MRFHMHLSTFTYRYLISYAFKSQTPQSTARGEILGHAFRQLWVLEKASEELGDSLGGIQQ